MMSWGGFALVALGGALGSVGRYAVSLWEQRLVASSPHAFGVWASQFPLATFSVNVLGSFIIGLVWAWLQNRSPQAAEPIRLFLLVGVLGGFTTFSAFSLETVHLLAAGQLARALVYVLASVLLCVFAAWAGIVLGSALQQGL